MIPVKPLSTHPDAGSGHVGGSPQAANATIANNCRKAATQSTPAQRTTSQPARPSTITITTQVVVAIARGGQ